MGLEIPHVPNKIVSVQAADMGRAVEKALAKTVDKYGSIMSDTFELHEVYGSKRRTHPYNLHFIYRDPDTKKPAVRIFYHMPINYSSEEFRGRMQEIKAWIVLLGQLRKDRAKKGEEGIISQAEYDAAAQAMANQVDAQILQNITRKAGHK